MDQALNIYILEAFTSSEQLHIVCKTFYKKFSAYNLQHSGIKNIWFNQKMSLNI